MAETARFDFSRLPEECLSLIISLTSPRDSCRSAAVSAAFRSSALSDAVWHRFLPPDLISILSRSRDPPSFASKKELYLRLCDRPILIDGGRRFEEIAELLDVCWLDISGRICRHELSPMTEYAAYLVFKIAEGAYGLTAPAQQATVEAEGREENSELMPRERSDGWMEVELGKFFSGEEGEGGEVLMRLVEVRALNWK
ncbi:F-box protein PP2-B10 [Apostasia shenzhenica]|uniref:F-box protein PP2-B10 n=1 Tax=Apostasia shenzhenica TaxID=1088818 RepID=A0A2I0ACW8_9ASPA|nr:F-box protein PP2-B10 [Apostasia shenzhenica]